MFIDPSLNLIVLIELVLIVPVLIPQVLIALVLLALVQILACVSQKLAPAKKIAEIYLQYLPLFASLPRCNLLFLVCCGRALVIAGDLLIFQLDPQ